MSVPGEPGAGKDHLDTAPLFVEQFGIEATPTLLVLQQGEVATRVVGFLSEGLLRVLCDPPLAATRL